MMLCMHVFRVDRCIEISEIFIIVYCVGGWLVVGCWVVCWGCLFVCLLVVDCVGGVDN